MALQTSGVIRLGDIHVEAEGSIYAGTSISSLNDTNIRGLTAASGYTINSSNGGTISIGDFYGASSIVILDTQTVTVGYQAGNQYVGPQWGFSTFANPVIGSVSDGTSNLYAGAAVLTLLYFDLRPDNKFFIFQVSGNRANSGWTTLTANGTPYQRSAGTFSYNSNSNYSRWEWPSIGANPMGTVVGATKQVQWT
tara:strand:+ start:1111 stop:1695 length:585 start_codon:yes stop_codon:yes gene_type:complete